MTLRDRTSGSEGRGADGQAAAHCPSCERFIGPADRCPYCGADAGRSGSLRVLRYAALALAVAGLAFLILMTGGRDLPVVRVADITPLMNFAYVRIRGTVPRKAYVSRSGGKVEYLSFAVDDGSGQLRVKAYGQVARRLVESGTAPGRDASVDVSGNLGVSGDGKISLRLQAIEQLRFVGPAGRPSSSP